MRRWLFLLLATTTVLFVHGCASTPLAPPKKAGEGLELVIFHNNDGESQLLNAGSGLEEFGGISYFSAKLTQLRAGLPDGVPSVFLSSGDNILPGPELKASIKRGPPFLDAIAISHLKYDALCFGNHDFDLGPDFLADFIEATEERVTFLAANLDFSGEPRLDALRQAGRIRGHKIITLPKGQQLGVIGIVTPRLPYISAPRKVKVSSRLAERVQHEVTRLLDKGVNKIILLSHLQDIAIEVDLVKNIDGVDVVIGGGGDELLSNPESVLVPGDEKLSRGPYPLMINDKSGRRIPVVTTAGSFRYIGKLALQFTEDGTVESINKTSGIFRIAHKDQLKGSGPDPVMVKTIVEPLKNELSQISKTKLATTEVALDGRRSKIRSQETNLGNLVADAFLWYAQKHASQHELASPAISIVNGGAIRNDSIIKKGAITELDAQKILPLPGFVSLVSNVPAQQLKQILEFSLENVGGGAFLQVSGLKVSYDLSKAKDRVRSVVLDNGETIVKDGKVSQDAPSLGIATLSFLAKGGGRIPLHGLDSENFAADYKKSLIEYLREIKKVTKKRYGKSKPQRLLSLGVK
jgi:2',3'-cyclic-nucleotide 2'-phosphodiesterase (5'-nucleotidase family)